MTNTLKTVAVLLTVALLSGCSDPVPAVADPHKIVIEGKAMTQQEFLTAYCKGIKDNPTCLKVSQAMAEDSTKSENGPARF